MLKLERVAAFLRNNTGRVAAAAVALLLASFLFGIPLKTLVTIPLLILAASFSTFYFNYLVVPVNFELVKLATVLAAASYGPVHGIAVGIASTFFGKVLIGRIDEKLPISMLAISLMAVAAAIFSAADITALGIALVLAYNLAMFSITQLMGGNLAWNLPYEGTNFAFNVILFAKVAPLLMKVMQS